MQNIFEKNKNNSAATRYKTFIRPPKNDSNLIWVIILIATVMVISPGLIDHFTQISRLKKVK